jgi:hypothetical protein
MAQNSPVKQVNPDSGAIADIDQNRLSAEIPIDFARLHKISGTNHFFERKLLEAFVQQTDIYLEEAMTALTEQNYFHLAHKMQEIKGTSQNVGILIIPEITSQIEAEITHKNFTSIAETMKQLHNIYQAVKEFIAADR